METIHDDEAIAYVDDLLTAARRDLVAARANLDDAIGIELHGQALIDAARDNQARARVLIAAEQAEIDALLDDRARLIPAPRPPA